jgi:DNA-binding response OmpR family regulator
MPPKHIVIVDDDSPFRMMIRKVLEAAGYRVSEAKNALAVFSLSAYDLMLLDIQMPGIDGHKVLASLREDKTCTAPIIVLTGMSDPSHRTRARAEGAAAFMTKPVNKEHLLSKIAELLTRAPAE